MLTLQGYVEWGGLYKYGKRLHIRFYIFFSFFVSLKLLSKYKPLLNKNPICTHSTNIVNLNIYLLNVTKDFHGLILIANEI